MPILYLLDNILYVNYKSNIYSVNLKDCIKYNYIINESRCLKKLEKFFKQSELKKINFQKGILLINECELNQCYKKDLYEIFDNLGISKIKYLCLKNIFKIKNNELFINLTDNYWQVFLHNKIYLIDNNLFNNHLATFVKIFIEYHKIKNIVLISNNPLIIKWAQKVEQITKIKTYYISNKLNYVLTSIKKLYGN